jgi:hypothetical protein
MLKFIPLHDPNCKCAGGDCAGASGLVCHTIDPEPVEIQVLSMIMMS